MTASQLINAIADALEAALPGWTVVRGSAHEPAHRQADITSTSATLGGQAGLGRYAVLEEVAVRLSVETGSDLEASYKALLDARDAALKAVAAAGTPFPGGTDIIDWDRPPVSELPIAEQDAGSRMFWTQILRFTVRRSLE